MMSEQLSPVVKETRLVSWPAFRIVSSESNLLVDPPLYRGFSGGPVFSLDEVPGSGNFRARHATLAGIYVGNIAIQSDEVQIARQEFLGRVVPKKLLIDLLNSESVKKYESVSKPFAPNRSLEKK
jgi:hypothetical protein